MSVPIPASYQVADRFFAGEYPGAVERGDASGRLRAFAEHGVTHFVDLSHPADSLPPYGSMLDSSARHVSHPIGDFGTTTVSRMARILDDIDEARAGGGTVYLHCWGGIGRTGTVVGCWLVRHELDEGDALRRLAALRVGCSSAGLASPETEAQRAMVAAWTPGR